MKRFAAIALTLLVLLNVMVLPSASAKTTPAFDVWVPTNTQKVLRDQAFPPDGSHSVRMAAARNEYEAAQVIVKAGDAGLQQLEVQISDLKLTNGNAKIDRGHIQLFKQHYIQVTTSTTAAYPKGWYPDALIPLHEDELLKVAAGDNQGIWIKVQVPKGQPAGTYTGEIWLHETGNPVRVPIEFTVWDFELTDESHAKTAFTLWGDQVAAAHNNVAGEEFWSLLDKYYWASVEERLTPSYLPVPFTDVNEFVRRAEPYITNPKVSAYRLQLYRDASGNVDEAKTKQLVDLLREKGLLAKAFFYLVDEPGPAKYGDVRNYKDILSRVAPDVPSLVTIQPVDELVGDVDIWTAEIDKYDPVFAQERQAAGDEVWWYTCVVPKHPFPSYHLDDDLVGTRLLSWMQRDNGVQGTLFWSTTIFKKWNGKEYIARDVWNDPMAFPGANGDGYLFYPGTALGIDGPVGTIRMETLREGAEDYEYLWQLEQRITEAAAKLGLAGSSFEVKDAIQPFYERLYDHIRDYKEDPVQLLQVRGEVANEIVSMSSGLTALTAIGKPAPGSREVAVYTEPGSTVTVNGQLAPVAESGAGYAKHAVVLPLQPGLHEVDIVVSKDGQTKTIHRTLAVKEAAVTYPVELNDAESDAAVKKWTSSTVTLALSNDHVTSGSHSMQATYKAGVKFPNIRLFDAGKAFRSPDWSRFQALQFDVFNVGETVQFYVKFHGTNGKTDDTFMQYVRANQGETITIPLKQVNLDLTQIKGIEIWMWQQTAPKTLYLDNFRLLSNEPADSMAL
ncbi:glycoside hydrolase domain-containing protein [Paenibacillus sp. HJGM_3]|uniref:DUF4091 domain-containing protein n=1 Tax=Paenibacillus sp. HJGM_3 TaxID=3379816 RepID=UPI00385DF566